MYKYLIYTIHNNEENRNWYITLPLCYLSIYTFNKYYNTYDFNRLFFFTYISIYILCGFFFMMDVYYEKTNQLQYKRYSKIKKIDYEKFIYGSLNCMYNSTLINATSRMLIFYPILKYRGYDNWDIKNYHYYEIFLSIIFTIFLADIYFYFIHKLFHTSRFLYNNIHYLHHKFVVTYSTIFNCGHIFEAFFLNECFIMLPLIITKLPKELIFIWIFLSNVSAVLVHCDYNIIGINHFIHHKKYNKYYGLDIFPWNKCLKQLLYISNIYTNVSNSFFKKKMFINEKI